MKFCVFVLSYLFLLSLNAAEPISVRLASINTEGDYRHQYSNQLLQLILSSSTTDIEVDWVPLENELQHITLLNNRVIDVFATATDKENEKDYHAIRYPLFKGLMGHRLILVRNDNREILTNIKNINGLKKFSIGQGSSWQESKIFSANGFVVNTSRNYNRLFEMLAKKRFDLFPRSILEVWNEKQAFPQYDISIEPHVLLHYPMAMFYFIRKDEPELSQALESGFKVAIDNGSFDALFNKHHASFIKRAKLEQRTLIEIPNPFFPPIPSNEESLYIHY